MLDQLKKGIDQTEKLIELHENLKKELLQVQDKLLELPEKREYQSMVPFMNVAFFPGTIVHTNEILVNIGENYFVECSATEAAAFTARKIERCNASIEQCKKHLEEMREALSLFQIEGEDLIEIKEEFVEEDEDSAPLPREKVPVMKKSIPEDERKQDLELVDNICSLALQEELKTQKKKEKSVSFSADVKSVEAPSTNATCNLKAKKAISVMKDKIIESCSMEQTEEEEDIDVDYEMLVKQVQQDYHHKLQQRRMLEESKIEEKEEEEKEFFDEDGNKLSKFKARRLGLL